MAKAPKQVLKQEPETTPVVLQQTNLMVPTAIVATNPLNQVVADSLMATSDFMYQNIKLKKVTVYFEFVNKLKELYNQYNSSWVDHIDEIKTNLWPGTEILQLMAQKLTNLDVNTVYVQDSSTGYYTLVNKDGTMVQTGELRYPPSLKQDSAPIVPGQITSITANPNSINIDLVNGSGSLSSMVTILPEDATNKTLDCVLTRTGMDPVTIPFDTTTSNEFTMDYDPTSPFFAQGVLNILFKAKDGSNKSGTLTINISDTSVKLTGLTLTPSTQTKSIPTDNGSKATYDVEFLPSNATNKSYKYEILKGGSSVETSPNKTDTSIELDIGTAPFNEAGEFTVKLTSNDGTNLIAESTLVIANDA